MNFDFVTNATTKELEQFKSVCNQLLSRTYIVRTIYQPGKGRVDNPDYLFLSRHYEAVQEYLSLLDWDLRRDELNGYFYVLNTDEANRCNLNKKETAILLALRLIYEENMERLGLEQDAVCKMCIRDRIQGEANGNPVELNIVLVHAQDHLTMATMAQDNAQEFINLYRLVKELQDTVNELKGGNEQ